MKLDLATFPTVPVDPPAAGPDRAFDPWPPDPSCPVELLPTTACTAPAEDDVSRPTNNPVTEPSSAAATISPRLRCESDSRVLGWRAGSDMLAEIGDPDEGASGRVVLPKASTVDPDGLPDSGSEGRVTWGLVGSWSLMTALLKLR
jgi:hypothetical protein